MSQAHKEQLIKNYFELCFSAIDLNRNRFPFKQIFEAAINKHDLLTITVTIRTNNNRKKTQKYLINIQDHNIKIASNLPYKYFSENSAWTVNECYLTKVLQNKDEYLQNPSYIDWGWLHQKK